MNLVTMDYFIALAEERSFTKAATRLAVTQQTLSAHIAGVERELGVRLVNRTVPLTLTYAGEEFLGYARRFQAERRALEQEFADIAGDVQGLLAVGIASTRGRLLMPAAISAFSATHPGVGIQLDEAENDELVEMLREGRPDMVVATVPRGIPGLVVRPLREERVVLLVAESLLRERCGDGFEEAVAQVARTGSLASLGEIPFLLLGEGDEPGDLSRSILARSGIRPKPKVMSKNSETLVDLAIRGVGACFVPEDLATAMMGEPEAAGLREVSLGPEASIPIHMAWRDSGHVWSVIEAFAQLLSHLYGDAS
jgi:DNA-binding transcriptional LysR family regulator